VVREFIVSSPYDPHLTYDEAGELLGTGPGLPRQLVAEGLVDVVRQGRSVRIPRSALIAYLTTPEDHSARANSSAISGNDAA
jgi:excisionase family DNA binding protein